MRSILRFVLLNCFSNRKELNRDILHRLSSNLYGMNRSFSFNFMNYNCIGFDLDHTICQYNLENIIKLQYKLLVNYLIDRGYPAECFSEDFSNDNVDFIQRGLFLDFKKGNVLYISEDGTIVRASHGTVAMSDDAIKNNYGKDKKWEPTSKFAENILSVWEPPWSDIMRSMMDFTDAQVPLVFGQMIDYIDKVYPGTTSYSVWPIILEGIIDMFKPGGSYYVNLYRKPHLYLKKCSVEVMEWLKLLKEKNKCIFILTGAREEEAAFLAEYSLGAGWRNLFDIIVYNAKKPGFFTVDRPFLDGGLNSNLPNSNKHLELSQGNWKALQSLISLKTCIRNPKSVYIGDNLLQDVYVTSLTNNIDAIALVEELSEESKLCKKFDKHLNSEYVKSSRWNSYIYAPNSQYTIWGSIIRKYSKLSIPSLQYVANKPVDHSFFPFWIDESKL